MSSHAVFRFREQISTRSILVGVVFIDSTGFNIPEVCDLLDSLYAKGPVPDIITIAVPLRDIEQIQNVIFASEFLARLRPPSDEDCIRILYFDTEGRVIGKNFSIRSRRISKLSDNAIGNVRNSTLTNWFRSRGGMMEAGEGYYYRKPSHKAVDRFIRTGNILVDSGEMLYLCFWLVGLIQPNTLTIWVDSSTILSVGYALVLARSQWLSEKQKSLRIRSFESYKSFDSLPKHDSRSFAIISASSGGAMAGDLFNIKNYPEHSIATLFYLSTRDSLKKEIRNVGAIICDLTFNSLNAEGYPPVIISKPDEDIFPPSAKPISITPEGFVPHGRKIETLELTKHHLPAWHRDIAKDILGKKMVAVNRVDECHQLTGGLIRRLLVGLDLAKAWRSFCNEPGCNTWLEKRLLKYLQTKIPGTLKYIIHAGDNQSKELAEAIARWLLNNGNPVHKCVSISEYSSFSNLFSVSSDEIFFTLVVGSCLFDMHPLLNASQLLRQTQKNNALGYLVPVQISKDKKKSDFDKINLSFCNDGVNYGVEVFSSFSANWIHDQFNAWEAEKRYWKQVLESSDVALSDEHEFAIADRLNCLSKRKGMLNDVFLKSPANVCVKLRRNSMFLEGLSLDPRVGSISQADTVFLISALISNLHEKGILFESSLHRVLVDPGNFNRFSDGVIQASILRLVRGGEMAYALDKGLSLKMTRFLMDLIANADSPRAEALTEFVFAIASGGLTLRIQDRKSVVEELFRRRKKISSPLLQVLILDLRRRI